MMEYFKKLFMANQAIFNKGRFIALGMPIVVYPIKLLTKIQKDFIKELDGNEGIYCIYESSKEGGKELSKESLHIAKNEKIMLSFLNKLVPIGGWGLITIKEDWEYKKFSITIENTPFAKLYGTTNEPICHIIRGLLAGAASIITKDTTIECIETNCIAKGDKTCTFEIMPKNQIKDIEKYKNQIKF
jgi:predicted hydrocarbon binding protein